MNGKQLKNSILQLAIQGKLVAQDANDEPASELLKRIRAEKERLVKEGKLKKKDLVTTPISDEEKPFEIPESWEWCRMPEIAQCSLGKALDAVRNTGENRNYVAGINVYWDRFDFSTKKQMKMNDEEFEKYKLEKNDLIICEGGDYGRCAVWQDEEAIAYQKALHRARFYQNIEPRFYLYYFMLQKETNGFDDFVTGTTIKHLTNVALNSFPFPLPPLAEQHRIVAKVEELMPLVEEYDKAQTKLDDLNRKLPEALKKSILQEAIMGKLVPQDPNDEPASELLKRIRAEKEQLVKDGKLKKKDLVTTPISDEEKPFEVPEGWEWCRLNDILDVRDGTHDSPKYHSKGYPLVTSKNLRNNKIDFSTALLISEDDYISISSRSYVDDGDILYAMIGSIGNPVIVKKDRLFAIKNMALFKKMNNGMDMKYAFWYLDYQQDEMRKYASGGVQSFVSLGYLRNYPIPLPPLSEQHRIVAKIEELMQEIDKLRK